MTLPRCAACSNIFASLTSPLVTAERSPVFDATRIVIPFPLQCSSTQTAMTLRLSSEVAERNARLQATSLSRTTLSCRVGSISRFTRFSLGISGSSSSCRRLLMDCCNCERVILLPHSVSMVVSSSQPCQARSSCAKGGRS
jgi:hypothetical protein